MGSYRNFDRQLYWSTRRACDVCGGLTRMSQRYPGPAMCRACWEKEEKRQRVLDKAEEAKARAEELQAKLEEARAEASNQEKAAGCDLIRDKINQQVRAELLSVQVEADQEYIELGAEIQSRLEELEMVTKAGAQDLTPTYNEEAVQAGVTQGMVGAISGFMVGVVALVVIVALAGGPIGDLAWVVLAVPIVVLAVLFGYQHATEKARETTRRIRVHRLKHEMQQKQKESRRRTAELEQKLTELRDKMVRKSLTPAARKLIWERDNKTCYLCGGRIKSWRGAYMHVDHLFPWSHGGTNDPENLRATHVRCNLEKSNYIIDES